MQTNRTPSSYTEPDGAALMLTRAALALVKEHGALTFTVGIGNSGMLSMGADVLLDAGAASVLVEAIEAKAEREGYILCGTVGEEQVTPRGKVRPIAFVVAPCAPTVVH